MLDIFSTFATDRAAEISGKEFQIGTDAFVTVARSGNSVYRPLFSKLWKASEHTLAQKDDAAEKRGEEIHIEVLAKTVLLSWRGISLKGEVLEPSVENAKKLLAIPDFKALIVKLSDDFSNFKLAQEALTEGN